MSEQVKAWEKWKAENAVCFDRSTLGGADDYLYNRLWRAFMEGFQAGEKLAAPLAPWCPKCDIQCGMCNGECTSCGSPVEWR